MCFSVHSPLLVHVRSLLSDFFSYLLTFCFWLNMYESHTHTRLFKLIADTCECLCLATSINVQFAYSNIPIDLYYSGRILFIASASINWLRNAFCQIIYDIEVGEGRPRGGGWSVRKIMAIGDVMECYFYFIKKKKREGWRRRDIYS